MKHGKDNRGFITIKVLLLSPFLLWLALATITFLQKEVAEYVTAKATRNAHRILAVSHDAERAKGVAVDVVSRCLVTELSIPGSTRPKKSFDPDHANSIKDALPDVYTQDDGSECLVGVRYHVVVLAPGMGKLLNKDAEMLEKYITVEKVIKGPREITPP
ncbi:hypothetical protein [Desulforamulus ruminis]|uniref:TadE family protein n=1 Tax=Desulforamulus ruminis (strain ATCC 23193 / DSM 2154 / NCIMB 8452 / DL) TaxID=696281 RepID=F6DTD7_DESRL|nr:hypothetical protein [Desulforamulus ruminis]AEG58954.1 hypothetical protein Desru_0669 [Desulforamulus ruminis DSM 2154]